VVHHLSHPVRKAERPHEKATSLELHTFLLLFAGGMLAGVINVIVGGAGFMTFPLLVAAGMSEIEANASNFVAVLPANVVGTYAYRSELASVRKHLGLRLFLAALGGIIGSTILIYTGQASFQRAIPWLLLFATFCFAAGPSLKLRMERHFNFDGSRWLWLAFILEFLVYVYGGYFGLGMGILMFTIYALFTSMNLHQANALRNITISLMTLISIVIFARAGIIRLGPAVVMMTGAILGSYFAAKIAKRIDPRLVRNGILVWAIILTAFAFWKYY